MNWEFLVYAFGMIAFQQQLIRMKHCLKVWNKEVFGNVFTSVEEVEKEVSKNELIYDLSRLDTNRMALNQAKAILLQALSSEEYFMRQ